MSFKQYQQILLNAINLDLKKQPDIASFFREISLQDNQIILSLSDYRNEFDSETNNVKEILLDNSIVQKISNLTGFVTAESVTAEYLFKAYFTCENIDLIKNLFHYIDILSGEIQPKFNQLFLAEKQNYIDLTQQEIIDLNNLIIARKDLLETAKNDLKKAKQENSLVEDLVFEAKKKSLLS